MKQIKEERWFYLTTARAFCALMVLFLVAGEVSASDESSGLLEWMSGVKIENTRLLRAARLSFSGWVNGGINYNPSNPGDGYNGPVTFTDRAGVPQLGQLYLSLERPVDMGGENLDLGAHIDFLFGSDAVFAETHGDINGHWDQNLLRVGSGYYSAAIPQIYLEAFIPAGRGIDLKVGHFYTLIGSESVMAPDNFFASHSYMMQYGEPFTHTGFTANYPLTELLNLNLGAATGSEVAGWDGVFDRNLDSWAFLGGLNYANDKGDTTASINAVQGAMRGTSPGDSNLYSMVFHHDFANTWHYTLQHDYGWTHQDAMTKTTEWYGIAHYLTHDIGKNIAAGLRAEWFRDDDGTRVQSGYRAALLEEGWAGSVRPVDAVKGSSFYALTAGLNWKPSTWITVRPSVRYDWADQTRLYDCQRGHCSQSDQLLFSADVILAL